MFRAKRQGVELSMNAIILMAIGLIILIIGAFFIMNSAGKLNNTIGCKERKGECLTKCNDQLPISAPYSCPKEGEKCCTSLDNIGWTIFNKIKKWWRDIEGTRKANGVRLWR